MLINFFDFSSDINNNMQYTTIAVALFGLLGSSMAAPTADAADDYSWSVTKWSFSRGQTAYDYSFSVSGPQDGKTPGFTATCSGTQKGGYKECSILPVGTASAVPTVYANVNIVTDPNDPNDTIPRVFVKETWTRNGCSYTQVGHHDATLNSGSRKGRKFPIFPLASAVC